MEKIAAEKLGNHEKKCPICEIPFKDVNEFMTHLSKCNVVESSEEELETTEKEENRLGGKEGAQNQENTSNVEELIKKNDGRPLDEYSKIKVRCHF